MSSAEALFWLATLLYTSLWAFNHADLWGAWEAHAWLKPLNGPVRDAAVAALVKQQVPDPFKLYQDVSSSSFLLLPAVPYLATFRWKGALARTIAVAGLQSLLLWLAMQVPTDLPRLTTPQLAFPAFGLMGLGTLLPALLVASATKVVLPRHRGASWAAIGLVALLTRYEFALPVRWLLDPSAWATLQESRSVVDGEILANRLFWLGLGLLAIAGARLWGRNRNAVRMPTTWDRLVLPVLTCLSVAAIEFIPLWRERAFLVAPGDVDLMRRYPAAIFLSATLAAQRAPPRQTLIAIAAGVFAAVSSCWLLDPGDLAGPFVIARIAFDLLAWLLIFGLLSALAHRWPESDVPLVLGCFALVASECGPGPLSSWSFLVRYPRLAYSRLGGIRWSLDGLAPSTLYGIGLVALIVLCVLARGRRSLRLGAAVLAPVVLGLGGWSMRLDRLSCPGGIWSGAAEPLWGIVYQATHQGWLDQPQPRIVRGRATFDIGEAGARVSVSGQFVVKNQTEQPISRMVVSVAPEAEDIRLSLAGKTLSVDSAYNAVEVDLSPPLAVKEERTLDFSYAFRVSPWRSTTGGIDGSVLLFANPGRQSSVGVLPKVGVGPFDLTLAPVSRAPDQIGWSEGILSTRSLEGADANPSDFALDLEIRMPHDWRGATVGARVDQSDDGQTRITRFRLEHAPNDVVVAAGRYQAASGVAGVVPVTILTATSRPPALGEGLLQEAIQVVQAEESMLGRLPVQSLTMAEVTDYQASDTYAGRAYPGLIVLNEALIDKWKYGGAARETLIEALGHEVAHQWFPAGTDVNVPNAFVEALAEGIALQWLRRDPDGRDYVRARHDSYFAHRADIPESSLASTDEADPLIATVRYLKGGLAVLALADMVGPDRFNAGLRSFLENTHGMAPPYFDPSVLVDSLRAVGEGGTFDHAFEDLGQKRITYENVASDAVLYNGAVELKLEAHRFDGGAGSERHEVNEDSWLPIGGIDCDGNPVILKWMRFQNAFWVHPALTGAEHLRLVGFDPWNELLDDGGKNLTEVKGNTCPTQ